MVSGGAMVTKSSPVLVVPSEPETAAGGTTVVALSSFDKIVLPFPIKLLLVFDRPIHEPAATIKTALSRALSHHYYQPVAGRLDGKGGIACTSEGVAFVAASATCTLDQAMATLQHMDLTVSYPGLLCRDIDPLLMVQVTEFSCGGFAVGVTWNHVLADGAGIGQFLQAVGELARGVSPPPLSVAPVRHWDDSLPGLPSWMVPAQKPTIDNVEPRNLVRHDIAVPSSLISRIKAESGGCTMFEAVAAVIWRCHARAAMSSSPGDSESPAPLSFPCNVRALVGAGTAGYYGNCVVVQVVPATSGAVASSSLTDLVHLIRRAKEKVPGLLSNDGGDRGGAAAQGVEWYNGLAVVSWLNLGFEVADFGGGGAARVMWHEDRTLVPGCTVCSPCQEDAVNVSALCVKPEHADAFLGELASLAAGPEQPN